MKKLAVALMLLSVCFFTATGCGKKTDKTDKTKTKSKTD